MYILTQQTVRSYMDQLLSVLWQWAVVFTIMCMASFRGGNHVRYEPLLHMYVLTQQRVCSYMYMASYYIQCIVVVGCSIEFTIVCMASFWGGKGLLVY